MGMFDEQTLGNPALSFKGVRRGAKIEGVLLPVEKLNTATGEVERKAWREDPARDQATGEVKTYPKSGDPIMSTQFLLQTDLTDWKGTSAKFEQRAQEDFPDESDTGLRRWFAESAYTAKAVREAYKKIRKAPEVGGLLTIRVVSLKSGSIASGPNAGQSYEYPELEVSWTPADADGKTKVAAYLASDKYKPVQAPAPAVMSDDNPWGDSDGEPVF